MVTSLFQSNWFPLKSCVSYFMQLIGSMSGLCPCFPCAVSFSSESPTFPETSLSGADWDSWSPGSLAIRFRAHVILPSHRVGTGSALSCPELGCWDSALGLSVPMCSVWLHHPYHHLLTAHPTGQRAHRRPGSCKGRSAIFHQTIWITADIYHTLAMCLGRELPI